MVTQGNDFCNGFTLQAATLILLHSILVLDSVLLWVYLHTFSGDESNFILYSVKIHNYRRIGYVFGIMASSIGIISIYKNKPKFLMFSILYFYCYLAYYGVCMMLLTFFPETYKTLIQTVSGKIDDLKRNINPTLFAYLSFMAAMLYFASIVKSCMDVMLKRRVTNHRLEMSERKPGYDCDQI